MLAIVDKVIRNIVLWLSRKDKDRTNFNAWSILVSEIKFAFEWSWRIIVFAPHKRIGDKVGKNLQRLLCTALTEVVNKSHDVMELPDYFFDDEYTFFSPLPL